ncbi:LacI family DNA-binding transcriptional regulator [Staphylococcus epidermidis]
MDIFDVAKACNVSKSTVSRILKVLLQSKKI